MNTILRASVLVLFFYAAGLAQFEGYTPTLPVQSTELYKSSNSYQQDFLYLTEALVEFHANVYKNFPVDEFNKKKELIFNRLKECKTDTLFSQLANSFTNKIKDGHTGIQSFSNYGGNTYPFKCKYLHDTLVIISVTDQLENSFLGEGIKAINDISIKNIEDELFDQVLFENYVSMQNYLMLSINSTSTLRMLNVIKNNNEEITIVTFSGRAFKTLPNSNNNWQNKFPVHPVTERNYENFSYKIDSINSICYLQFNQFIDKRIGEMYLEMAPLLPRWWLKIKRFFGGNTGYPDEYFEDFLNRMISDINKAGIKKVFIDMRYNTGGGARLGDLLLYALGVDKYKGFTSDIKFSELYKIQMERAGLSTDVSNSNVPSDTTYSYTIKSKGADKIINRFNGKVYFGIAEWTFSSAVMLATIVKDNKLFTVIGEPIKERPSHFGEVLFLKLPNSGLMCSLSCKQFHRPDISKDNEETLIPDVLLYKTYRTINAGIDPLYEYVIGK